MNVSLLRREEGQMTVELAVMLPAMVAIGLIVFNIVKYAEVCAAFDRVALDAAVTHGVSPAGEQSGSNAVKEVEGTIRSAIGSSQCEVEVSASGASAPRGRKEGLAFPMSPLLTTYTCRLRFHPWPRRVSIAGVGFSVPLSLTHERSITVDRFRPGVVI